MKKVPSPLRRSCEQKNSGHLLQPFFHRCYPFIYARAITLYHVPLLSSHERHIAITDWSDYSSQPHFLNLLKLSNYRQTPFFHLNYSHFPENSTKFYSRTYSHNILCNIKMDIYTIHTHHYDELHRTVFYKARDIRTAFYSSTIFQQSGTFYINSSPEDHEWRGCKCISEGYFTDLCGILELQETTCWIYSKCPKTTRHSWSTNIFSHQRNLVTSKLHKISYLFSMCQ